MWVIKTTGEKEEFQPEKIRNTCLKAGASLGLANKIVKRVEKRAYSGISTRKILELILRHLEKEDPIVATRYDLKDAIIRLGPAGFAFEKLVKEILKAHGYKVRMPEILYGTCIKHEVDVIAQREECYMVECKFHNAPGIYSGTRDVLYAYARFLDLKDGFRRKTCSVKFDRPMVVCNTRFSRDALQYALCKKMKLISWKYPKGDGLRELLEQKGLYPITVLRTINKFTQKKLAKHDIMLCRQLVRKDFQTLKKITGMGKLDLVKVIDEAKQVVKSVK